ncbi:glutathione S-transferase, C-terminal-like protein [Nitzschia inconspicua]|uniref:Glutathione S-transferase, C-terminal-like protein n=1 Tax=Nitzschia inconspicua TaxID=303405 RepID=A0A9K3LC65_9STRA|nr:glutathione S-transferase, C-terminal-like protein [Nitzschia inconspicua]
MRMVFRRPSLRNILPSGYDATSARGKSSHSSLDWQHHLYRCLSSSSRTDSSNTSPVNLYQYKICPFSNIAKVVLTYQQIPFQSIEVNPLTKAELKFSKDYRKVPIVQQDNQQWNGTEEILEHFTSKTSFVGNDSFSDSPSAKKWADFARNKLAPLLYPNLCNTLSNSFRSFDYVHQEPHFSTLQKYSIQYIGSIAMYFAASKIKKKYQLDDVRVALDEALLELEEGLEESSTGNEFADTNTFLSKTVQGPNLGDLAVFGVLKGLEGLPILTDDILQDKRYLKIQHWYKTMDQQVESKK